MSGEQQSTAALNKCLQLGALIGGPILVRSSYEYVCRSQRVQSFTDQLAVRHKVGGIFKPGPQATAGDHRTPETSRAPPTRVLHEPAETKIA